MSVQAILHILSKASLFASSRCLTVCADFVNTEEAGAFKGADATYFNTLKIDNTKFENQSAASSAIIYAVANVDPLMFSDVDENGLPVIVRNLADLEKMDLSVIFLRLLLKLNMTQQVKHLTISYTIFLQ